jgi:hypothetical protein
VGFVADVSTWQRYLSRMLLLLLALQSSNGTPLVFHGRTGGRDVTIPRLEATAKVDGVLDDSVWAHASRLTGFSQYRPVDGRPAADSTEVLVWYAPDAIWFGVRAFESHGGSGAVRATLADRDNIGADDQVQILLDTFNDRRRALLFAVNPLGVQEDGVRSEGQAGAAGGSNAGFRFDGIVDLNPDYVFESRGRITAGGYEIEVRVPFKSLRYQSTARQDWGLQLVRVTQHSAYEDTWTPVVRANASFLIQSGRIVGLTGLRRGLVMDVTPEYTTRVDGVRDASGFEYGKAEPGVGGTLRWGLTQNLSLNATANPDFSQVEADVGQVTVNERFALFFPEKRPFFLEGLEQFDSPNALIYMRRVQDPVAGVKLTGKAGTTAIAYLAAVDNVDDVHPVYNLLRLRRDLGRSSNVGLVYTDRVHGDDYNRVLGFDTRLIWRTIWFSDAQIVGSWTRDAAGGARAGHLWDVTFYDRTGRSYGNHAELIGISPDFQAQSGFVNRSNVVFGRLFNRLSTYGKPGAAIEQLSVFFLVQPTWRYRDFGRSTLEGSFGQSFILTLRGGWAANLSWQNQHLRFDGPVYGAYREDSSFAFLLPHGLYNLWGASLSVNTPNRALTGSFALGLNSQPIFDEASRGRELSTFAQLSWRPTDALRAEARWTHSRLVRAATGERFSLANIPRLKVEYQLTRAIFFRYVGQYIAQSRAALVSPTTGRQIWLNDEPVLAAEQNDFRSDFLFSYRPNPGTVLFLGYGALLNEDESFRFRELRRMNDGVFLKASYLFRF